MVKSSKSDEELIRKAKREEYRQHPQKLANELTKLNGECSDLNKLYHESEQIKNDMRELIRSVAVVRSVKK